MNLKRFVRALRAELHINVAKQAASLVTRVLPHFSFNRTRTAALRAVGVRIGTHAHIMGPVVFTGDGSPDLLSIGDHSMVSGPLHVDLGARVAIGRRVHIGHYTLLLTNTHAVGGPEERCGELRSAAITIEDGVWLGARVTVLPGITIGRGAVVAAGAVVTSNVPPNTMAAGVPARIVKVFDKWVVREERAAS